MFVASKDEFEAHAQKSVHHNAIQNERSMMRSSMQFTSNAATTQHVPEKTTVRLLTKSRLFMKRANQSYYFSTECCRTTTNRKRTSCSSCNNSKNNERNSTTAQSGSSETICKKGRRWLCSTETALAESPVADVKIISSGFTGPTC